MGDMFAVISEWWDEVKTTSINSLRQTDEITKPELLRFLLKKKLLVDEKELDSFLKEFLGD